MRLLGRLSKLRRPNPTSFPTLPARVSSAAGSALLRVPSNLSPGQDAAAAGPAGAAAADATAAAQQQAQAQEERSMRAWQSVRHVNGVAVYAEEEGLDGEGGALMVSAIVRSSPQECFEVCGCVGAWVEAGACVV